MAQCQSCNADMGSFRFKCQVCGYLQREAVLPQPEIGFEPKGGEGKRLSRIYAVIVGVILIAICATYLSMRQQYASGINTKTLLEAYTSYFHKYRDTSEVAKETEDTLTQNRVQLLFQDNAHGCPFACELYGTIYLNRDNVIATLEDTGSLEGGSYFRLGAGIMGNAPSNHERLALSKFD